MKHQSFDFFRRIRTLCPKQRYQRIHMFDGHGQPLSPPQELSELVQYFGTQFHDPDFQPTALPALQVLPFDESTVHAALQRLPATKAVAPPCLPAIVWKVLATELVGSTYRALAHWWSASPPQAPDEWTAGWLHLIPKPGKPSTKPQALRPICLQHPVCKVASSFVTTQLLQYTIDKLRCFPLYAYLPNRSTADCLLRVSHHCRQVRDDCHMYSQDNSRDGMFGGLQVSLDMNKAFDSVSRNTVSLAILGLQLPPDLQTMIHTLLSPHKYYIPHKKLVGEILATRGIRQGSKDGPILWTLCMHLVLTDLAARYSYQWIHEHVIIYADDVHLRWRTSQLADGLTALSDLDHILRVFRMYGFSINLDKSVVLFRAVGKGAHRFTKRWVVRTKAGPFLTMPDSSIRLPMVSKTAYLGVIIGYRAWEMDTVARRAQAAHMCFSTLRKWLTAQCVPQDIRFRLYHQCIVPTLMYGIHEMGITQKGFRKIVSIINVHYRRMIRAPVHLTHESTQDMFCRLNQPSPWAILQSHNLRLRQSLLHKIQQAVESAMDDRPPDVIALTPDYPTSHLDTPSDSSQPHAQDPSLECPECHRQFNQAGILKRHMRQMHHIPCLPEDVYNPLRDSFDGTSVCRHCMTHFSNMTTLRTHINKRVCTAFDLHQALVIPIVSRPEVAMHIRHRSYMGLYLDKPLCLELATRCAFCNQQVHAKAMTRHYRDHHQEKIKPTNTHLEMVRGFANFGSGRGECPLCCTRTLNVHTHQCSVVYQLAAMTAHVFDPAHFPVMPCMKRAWYPSSTSGTDQVPDEAPDPGPTIKKLRGPMDLTSTPDSALTTRSTAAPSSSDQANTSPSIYKCTQCPAVFLSPQGLTQHQEVHHTPGSIPAPTARQPKRGRPPGKDTIQTRLAETATTEIPVPLSEFTCPLCLEVIGRKGLAQHVRLTHQVDKPESFPFRPSRDMMPGRLSCIHCRASFTMPFALQNHFSRGTCPQLVIQWIHDQHYGPSVPLEVHDATPLPRWASDSVSWTLGIRSTGHIPDCMDMIHHVPMPLYHSIAFVPEARLHWYAQTTRWVSHFRQLPQVLLTSDLLFRTVAWITAIVPFRWAWHSNSMDSWWTPQNVMIDTYSHQQLTLHHVLMELEHALARDLFLTIAGSRDGRTYVQRRHVLLRSGRGSRHSCETASNGRLRIFHPDWQGQIETSIQLLGLIQEVRTGCFVSSDAGETLFETGRHDQCHVLGPQFPPLSPGRQGIHTSHHAHGLKRMAHSEAAGWCDLPSAAGAFLESGGGASATHWPAQCRRQRRRTLHQSSEQTDLECPKRMELHVVGSAGQMSETHQAGATFFCSRPGDPDLVDTPWSQHRVDPQICPDEAYEPRRDSGRQPIGDPVATGHFPAQPGISADVWCVDGPMRERHGTDGAFEDSYYLPPAIPAGSGHCKTGENVARSLLTHAFSNSGNACYLNSVMLSQLWSMATHDCFTPAEWGAWGQHLLSFLTDAGWQLADLVLDEPFRTLHGPWLNAHPWGTQQDAAEYSGWLREQFMQHSPWGRQANGWQSRLTTGHEDGGALIAPILLRCPDQKTCSVQNMIHAWHQQSPYTNACLSEHPNICLQIERFPDLHTKNRMNVDFPRSCVQIPIFARTSGLDVYWAEYRIVSLTLHLGEGPHSGHYQSCLLTSGNLWMTDDDRLPWLSCLHPAMQKDCYLIWLVPQMGLAKFWRRPFPKVAAEEDPWTQLLEDTFR